MNRAKLIKLIVLSIALAITAFYIFYKVTAKKEIVLFKTDKLEKRTINQVINATGTLEAKGSINISSLVNGIVEKLYVEENQQVKKDQLLAKIDDGKGDTNVKQAEGLLLQAKANLEYQEQFYARQKKLFDDGHIAEDEFQLAKQARDTAIGNVKTQDAYHAQAMMEFNNKKITSPIDGVIIKEHVSVREGVANFSPPTILYTIAEDINTMHIELEVDETDIGLLKIGQKANLHFNTYPHKKFYGTIDEISNAPVSNIASVAYKAVIKIENKKRLLKPGMTVHAQIIVARAKNALAVPGYLFALDKKLLKGVAKEKNYAFKKLSDEELESFKNSMQDKEHPVKTLWIFQDNAFIQKAVEIGVTDNAYFEILTGITDTDHVIIDVQEPDAMKKFYKKFFGGLGDKS